MSSEKFIQFYRGILMVSDGLDGAISSCLQTTYSWNELMDSWMAEKGTSYEKIELRNNLVNPLNDAVNSLDQAIRLLKVYGRRLSQEVFEKKR